MTLDPEASRALTMHCTWASRSVSLVTSTSMDPSELAATKSIGNLSPGLGEEVTAEVTVSGDPCGVSAALKAKTPTEAVDTTRAAPTYPILLFRIQASRAGRRDRLTLSALARYLRSQ